MLSSSSWDLRMGNPHVLGNQIFVSKTRKKFGNFAKTKLKPATRRENCWVLKKSCPEAKFVYKMQKNDTKNFSNGPLASTK